MSALDLTHDLSRVSQVVARVLNHDQALVGPVSSHILTHPGKRLRTRLLLASRHLSAHPVDDVWYSRAAAIELLHAATLLHDDVIDQGEYRRGRFSANRLWGNTPSILTGDYLFTKAFELVLQESSLNIAQCLNKSAMNLIEGESLQYAHRGNVTLSFEMYFRIIGLKTAELFATSCGIGADSVWELILREYGYHFGILFQLSNDQRNLGWREFDDRERIGSDIREKQITLPILMSYQYGTKEIRRFWTNLMTAHVEEGSISEAIDIMCQQDIPELIKVHEEFYQKRSLAALDKLPTSGTQEYLRSLLENGVLSSLLFFLNF